MCSLSPIMESHHHSHFLLHNFLHSKMGKLYIFQALLSFAKSMIGVFVPVFLYKIGFTIPQILFYIISISFSMMLFLKPATKAINKIGFKYTIFLTVPIYLAHILSINFVQNFRYMYILSGFLFGVYCAFFWPAYHSEIMNNSDRKHMSNQIGNIQIIVTLVSTLAPLIGGFILESMDFLQLFTIASIIIIIGIIPLLMSIDVKLLNYKYDIKRYIKLVKSKKYRNCMKTFAAQGIEIFLVSIIWPIIIFKILGENFLSFGFFLTIISLITVLIIYFIKKYFDKNSKTKAMKKTYKTMSLGWFFRSLTFVFGFIYLYFVEGILRVVQNIGGILFDSIFYNNARGFEKYLDYIIVREMIIHNVKIIFLILVIIVFLFVEPSIKNLSILLILGTITSYVISGFREINPENL